MSKVQRIDGVGTRRDSSGNELANLPEREQSIRLFAYAHKTGGAVTITAGDALALEYRSAKNITDPDNPSSSKGAVAHFGFSNVVVPLITTDELEKFPCGIAKETVTIADGDFAIIDIQVAGKFENANVASGLAVGKKVFASGTAGRLDATAADIDEQTCLAVALEAESSNKADVYLLDPMNLAE